MRPLRRLAVLLTLALLACTPPTTQTPHSPKAARLESETVALVAAGMHGPRAYCSGVWVGADAFLTAAHCVADLEVGESVAYVTRGDLSAAAGDEVEAVRFGKLSSRDATHDLALVKTALSPAHQTAGVADPIVGESVQTMGHPLGLWWSYSTGQVAAVRLLAFGDDDAIWYVQSTAPISPGNSGGGLFDSDGNLLGLCNSYMPRGENVNFYIDSRYIRLFLGAAL